jgi:hypothetical protein
MSDDTEKLIISIMGLGSLAMMLLGTAISLIFLGFAVALKVFFASFLVFVFAFIWTIVFHKD